MTDTDEGQRPVADRSVRPVIEHALTDYGYSAETARELIDRLLSEGEGQ